MAFSLSSLELRTGQAYKRRILDMVMLDGVASTKGRRGTGFGFVAQGQILTTDDPIIAQLTALIAPEVEALGFGLVRVAMIGGQKNRTLQVMAEDAATGQLTLDQCAEISRRISDLLDEKDPIEEAYRLEVSSPGIDRPLTRAGDYARWAGHVAKVATHEPVAGRKRFQGRLLGLEGEAVRLDAENMGEILVPLTAVQSAKLVLTDDLIKATVPLSIEGADMIQQER